MVRFVCNGLFCHIIDTSNSVISDHHTAVQILYFYYSKQNQSIIIYFVLCILYYILYDHVLSNLYYLAYVK